MGSFGGSWAVVLLAHGSRRGEATAKGMEEMARRLRERLGDGSRVGVAYLEALSPSLAQAVEDLAREGVRRVVVLPCLLGEGHHAREVRELVRREQSRRPDLHLTVGEGLGGHPGVAELAARRAREAMPPEGPRPWGLVLAKAGTRHPDPMGWLERLGREVARRLGPGVRTGVARASHAPPLVEEVGEALLREGVLGLTVVPCLLFPGTLLHRDIAPAVERLRGRWPNLPITLAPPLGVDDLLVEALRDRLDRAVRSG